MSEELSPKPQQSEADRLLMVQAALAESGSARGAAKLLGCSHKTVLEDVRKNPHLKAYLPNAKAPTPEELIVEPPPSAAELATPEEAKAAAIAAADRQLRNGLSLIGLTPEAVGEAAELCGFAKVQFESLLHLTNGGMAKLFIQLMADVKSLSSTINDEGLNMDIEEETMLRNDRSTLIKSLIDIANYNREAAITAAKIKQMSDGGGDPKGKKKSKPAFSALEVRTSGPATIRSASA